MGAPLVPKPWEVELAPRREARRVALDILQEANGKTCGGCRYACWGQSGSGFCTAHDSAVTGGQLFLRDRGVAACRSYTAVVRKSVVQRRLAVALSTI